jgi:hypothetical protein
MAIFETVIERNMKQVKNIVETQLALSGAVRHVSHWLLHNRQRDIPIIPCTQRL